MCELQYGRPAGCLSVQQRAQGLRWWAGRAGRGWTHTLHMQPASQLAMYLVLTQYRRGKCRTELALLSLSYLTSTPTKLPLGKTIIIVLYYL